MSFAFGATDTAVTDKTATSELSAWIGGENPTEAKLELRVKLNDPKKGDEELWRTAARRDAGEAAAIKEAVRVSGDA